ncbi:cupin domain-containing protein [Natronococcus jeotgali]|uniref:Cupin n=1 Tax=Natronococcus jeotgali DSM 18795 TaxID=1227498 RepID=L9XH09_9EURY|nr:cupin domain-containing protein [Natronococcus jeotgali]ELY60990.1 cupin [Natronococcus jeotgali DSM 18795]
MATEGTVRRGGVQPVELYRFEGTDVWQEGDENARIRGYFPLSPGTPNAGEVAGEEVTIVCLEIEPGNYLPTHRDSNEELLVVVDGTVEASVGEERVELSSGQCAIVPEMEPHGIRNVGDATARVIGFFPNDELTATFDETLMPFDSTVVTIGGRDE